jgi:hypothetical protein
MGHQFSKTGNGDASSSSSSNHPDQLADPRGLATLKAIFDNDGFSRATEITDASMTPPPSPRLGMFRHCESWRRDAAFSTTSSSSRESPPPVDGSHSARQHQQYVILPRRDYDAGHSSGLLHSRPPRTVPVKCPPRLRQTASGDASRAISPEDGLEASYLERIYDSRTWEMYRRITEARRRSRAIYVPNKTRQAPGAATVPAMDLRQGPTGFGPSTATAQSFDDTSEWEHLEQEEETLREESQHEMIFLFDF